MKTDNELQREVFDKLRWEPGLNAAEIGVSVKEGTVTLTGCVESLPEKRAAERAAKRVYEAKALVNNLEVRVPGSSGRKDVDIVRPGASCPKCGPAKFFLMPPPNPEKEDGAN